MNHTEKYLALIDILVELKQNKTNREVAIVITELEKVIAYYKMYVIDNLDE
jgi:predicted nucleotidyltransferase